MVLHSTGSLAARVEGPGFEHAAVLGARLVVAAGQHVAAYEVDPESGALFVLATWECRHQASAVTMFRHSDDPEFSEVRGYQSVTPPHA